MTISCHPGEIAKSSIYFRVNSATTLLFITGSIIAPYDFQCCKSQSVYGAWKSWVSPGNTWDPNLSSDERTLLKSPAIIQHSWVSLRIPMNSNQSWALVGLSFLAYTTVSLLLKSLVRSLSVRWMNFSLSFSICIWTEFFHSNQILPFLPIG